MKRRVIVYQDESGRWCVLRPSLGAFSQGENREDALASIRELLPAWIDDGRIEVVEISLEPHKT